MKLNDVKATLKHGVNISTRRMVFLEVMWIEFFCVSILTEILGFIDADWHDPEGETQKLFILSLIMFFVFNISITVLMCIVLRQRKEIRLWLKDAVVVEGTAVATNFPQVGCLYQICVRFLYDGQQKQFISRPRGMFEKVPKVFKAYMGHEIQMLYSPTYNEVMLLEKPQKRKKKNV